MECGKPYPWTSHAIERVKWEIERHATERNVSATDVATLKETADALASGTATEDQVDKARSLLDRFGPAGAVIWSGLTDITAKVLVGLMRP